MRFYQTLFGCKLKKLKKKDIYNYLFQIKNTPSFNNFTPLCIYKLPEWTQEVEIRAILKLADSFQFDFKAWKVKYVRIYVSI